jgi:hypothetical protein
MKTGIVKQVANFEKLVSTATALGAGYNPTKGSNKLPALKALLDEAYQSLQTVKATETKYTNATNARMEAFTGIDKLVTRMVNALACSDASDQSIEDAMMVKQKMYGSKPSATSAPRKKSSDSTGASTAIEDPPSHKSVGMRDYDNQAALFGKLVTMLESEPLYQPNEPDLQVKSLAAITTLLRERNHAVNNALAVLKVAKTNRNALLFANGIYKVAKSVKRYIKSAFGAQSEQFASIGGLEFKKK